LRALVLLLLVACTPKPPIEEYARKLCAAKVDGREARLDAGLCEIAVVACLTNFEDAPKASWCADIKRWYGEDDK
jgi:hypothetical protein